MLHGVVGAVVVGAGSLSGHAEVIHTYTVNSHVVGRKLTYLTHKSISIIWVSRFAPSIFGHYKPQCPKTR
jgi:hypothetical protein